MAKPTDTPVESEKSKITKKVTFNILDLPDDEEENLVAIDSESEDTSEETFSSGACNNEASLVPRFEVLPPHLPKHMVKGGSKTNLAKGKRPMVNTVYTIHGDLVPTKNNPLKRIFELTEESIRHDRLERIRGTLSDRIVDLHVRKLLTLEDAVKVFYSQAIPISLKLPISLTTTSLATLLLIEESSDFLETLGSSLIFQESVRKKLLEEKNLPVCRCGFIYVHPSLTYTNHPVKSDLVIGNLGDVVAVEEKKLVIQRLNSLRFFLEILYEHLKLNK